MFRYWRGSGLAQAKEETLQFEKEQEHGNVRCGQCGRGRLALEVRWVTPPRLSSAPHDPAVQGRPQPQAGCRRCLLQLRAEHWGWLPALARTRAWGLPCAAILPWLLGTRQPKLLTRLVQTVNRF